MKRIFALLLLLSVSAKAYDGWGIYNNTTSNCSIATVAYTYTVLYNGSTIAGPGNVTSNNIGLYPGGDFGVSFAASSGYVWNISSLKITLTSGVYIQTNLNIPYGSGYQWIYVSQFASPTNPVPQAPPPPTEGSLPSVDDTADLPPNPKKDDCGMPVWDVTEPFISLWLRDEPLGYAPAVGPRVSFELSYDQRDPRKSDSTVWGAWFSTNRPSVGSHWNCSWLSFISGTTYHPTVYFAGGGQQWFSLNGGDNPQNPTYTQLAAWPSFPYNCATNYLILTYPDGSQNWYFSVTNTGGLWTAGFLAKIINPQGQTISLNYAGYNPSAPVIKLTSVVDGDGRTNFIYYDLTNNLITRVADAFGRTAYLSYNSRGDLTNITDVAGNASSMGYDTNHWVTSLTTPYGVTSFATVDGTNSSFPNGRSILITKPDSSRELYLYSDNAAGLADSYASPPNISPFTDGINNLGMKTCNSFHWGPRQYAALSTTNINLFTAADFVKAHLKHWLINDEGYAPLVGYSYDNSVSPVINMEREPSPDSAGNFEGQKTWYSYLHQYYQYFETYYYESYNSGFYAFDDAQFKPLMAAKVLPDGATALVRTDRNLWGYVTTNISTYAGGLRTNWFGFATNGLDLITITNAAGLLVASNSYNGWHEPLAHFDALNELTRYAYNTNQQLAGLTQPNGLVTTNVYNADHSLAQQIIMGLATNAYTYANDLVFTHTDARGLTTTNTWDKLNRLTSTTFPDGTYVSNVYTKLDLTATRDRLTNWTYLAYDALQRPMAVTNALGKVTLYNYCSCGALDSVLDAATNLTQFYYDNQGRLTNTVSADNFAAFKTYNLLGQVVTTGDNTGYGVTNTYNKQGLLASSQNAAGLVATNSYDILDRITNRVDANGVSVGTTYDKLNRPLTRRYPDSGVEAFGYTLNVSGPTSHTNQLKNVTQFAYDPLGRKTNEAVLGVATNGQTFSGAGDLLALTDGRNQTTTWHYDVYGRMTNKVDAAGVVVQVNQYDANNRLTNRWTPEKGGTTYTYDAGGNRTNINYGGTSSTSPISFAYDALNRMTSMADGLGATHFGYNAAGEVLSAGGLWSGDTVSYTYTNRLRRSVSVGTWNQTYAYDKGLRLTNTTSGAGSFGYAYDAVRRERVARVSLPNLAYITNSYDAVARLRETDLNNHWGHTLDGYVYGDDLLGQRTNVVRNYGLTSSAAKASYDAIGELTSWSGQETNGVARLNEQLGYAYDAAGNLKQRTNNALVQAFAVDAANALTNVTRTGTFTMSGNTPAPMGSVTVNGLAAQTYADFTFAGTNNSLANGTNVFAIIAQNKYGVKATNTLALNLPISVPLQMDANGNLTNDGAKSLCYDAENQLTNVTVAGQWREDFLYDGLNRRRITRQYIWQGGGWTLTNEVRFVYDGNAVVQEWDSNNVAQVTYTRGINGLLARTDANGSVFYHADGNQNITALIDGHENMVGRYLYDPFGKPLGQWGSKADVNVYRFASKEWDYKAGFYYFGRRFYDPGLQRWLNHDPIQEHGGQNLYAYCGNNPVSLYDPLGFCWWDDLLTSLEMDADTMGYGLFDVPYQMSENAVNSILAFGSGTADAYYNGQGGWDWMIGGAQDIVSASTLSSLFIPEAGFARGGSTVIAAEGENLVKVTSWAGDGAVPDLIPGRWVVKGDATPLNFIKTGLWSPKIDLGTLSIEWPKGPFTPITAEVPKTSVIPAIISSPDPLPVRIGQSLFGQYRIGGGL